MIRIVWQMRGRAAFAGFALVAALAVAGLGTTAAGARSATARLTLDGVVFQPEVALDETAREKGLMYRASAPKDGMLFVFPRPTSSAFWMKNTRVPLVVTFFDAAGKRVRRLSMKPCRSDPCPIYSPGRSYRFALELPVSDRRPASRLGPVAQLRRLVQRAS